MKRAIFSHMSVVITSRKKNKEEVGRFSSYGKILKRNFLQLFFLSVPLSPSLCLSHSVYSSIFFFLENTTVPNLHEVKENMTMGTTLVTNPSGGFLVRGTLLFVVYKKCYTVNPPSHPPTELHIFCKKTGQRVYVLWTFALCGNSGLDPPCFPVRLHVLGM